jgi:hypothetical protein
MVADEPGAKAQLTPDGWVPDGMDGCRMDGCQPILKEAPAAAAWRMGANLF